MSDPLQSARYTAARAKVHAAELERETGIFHRSDPYVQVVELDTKTGDKVCKMKLVKPIPTMLAGIAADAVNNFRQSLDQAAYAVSFARYGTGVKNTHFPFGDTAAEVKNRKAGGSKDIPDEIFAVMESLKPYLGGNDPLWALNKFCNANKHKIISPAVITTAQFSSELIKTKEFVSTLPPRWNSEKDEMELFRVHPPGGEIEYKAQLTMTISFNEIDFLVGRPIDLVLSTIAREVDSALDAISAEAFRIGLFV